MTTDTRRLYVLSTAHLTKQTANNHTTYREDAWLWPIPYGYMTWMWQTDDQMGGIPAELRDAPPELIDVIRHLRKLGADDGDYIRFDCDGEILRGLNTYEW